MIWKPRAEVGTHRISIAVSLDIVQISFYLMSQEDYPVEFVLAGIESAMAPKKKPKALLFDIGGVCVCENPQPVTS